MLLIMQNLSKIQINSRYENQYEVNSYLLSYGFGPVWDYDRQREMAICYVLYSTKDDLCNTNQKILDSFNNITGLRNIADLQFIGNIDLQYNTPSYINTTLNGNLRTITQETTVVQGTVTYNYTFTTSYNISTGVFTSTNSSSYSDSSTGIETETVMTPNPDGTTTSTTTTSYTDPNNPNVYTESSIVNNYDENGNYSGGTSEEITGNSDGSVSTATEVYNEDGNPTVSTTVTSYSGTANGTSSEGWETITSTTNYDENGNPSDGENQWVDPSGNENTQTIEYDENGDEYITGYEIDTTNNQNGGETLNNPIDTGVLAFDGRDFDVHLKAKFYWSNIQYNGTGTGTKINPILNLSANDTNNRVNGFIVSFVSRGSGKAGNTWWNFNGTANTSNLATIMRVIKYLNDAASSVYHIQKSPGLGTSSTAASGIGAAQNATGFDIGVIDITCRSNVFHISVTNDAGTLQTVCKRTNGSSPYNVEDINFGNLEFDDVTVELGHWDSVVDNVQYTFNYEVLEFSVTKL